MTRCPVLRPQNETTVYYNVVPNCKRCMVTESLWKKYDVLRKSPEVAFKRFRKVLRYETAQPKLISRGNQLSWAGKWTNRRSLYISPLYDWQRRLLLLPSSLSSLAYILPVPVRRILSPKPSISGGEMFAGLCTSTQPNPNHRITDPTQPKPPLENIWTHDPAQPVLNRTPIHRKTIFLP